MNDWEAPKLSTAVVLQKGQQIYLVKESDQWQLPQHFVEYGTQVPQSAKKLCAYYFGTDIIVCNQVGLFDHPDRDIQGHNITIAYSCFPIEKIDALEDKTIDIFDLSDIPELKYDHNEIVKQHLHKLSEEGSYDSFAFEAG